jgi:hypothetical protein
MALPRYSLSFVTCLTLAAQVGCRLSETNPILPPLMESDLSRVERDMDAGRTPAPSVDAGSLPDGQGDAGASDGSPGDAAGEVDPCPAEGCAVPEGCTESEHAGHRYLFCTDSLTWDDARSRCQAVGSDLVIIDDAEENAFVAGQISAPSWIGLSDRDTEGSFVWLVPGGDTRGVAPSYTRWAATKPDNCVGGVFGQQDCTRISANGTWDDSDCAGGCTEGTFAFVCERH